MSVTAAALRELHRIHQRLADLRDRLERGPKQVRAREANVTQLEAKLAEARDRAKQMQMAIDRKQLDLKSGEQKVLDLRVKLNGANSNREYQAFLEQIAAAEMAGSVLSDEILEGMDKVDQLAVATKEAEKNLGLRQAGNGKGASKPSSLPPPTIRTDVASSKPNWSQAEQAFPAELKADYERVVRSKGADSLSAADDGVCIGCGQQITLNMQNELRLSKLVFCKSCGRLLYLSGD